MAFAAILPFVALPLVLFVTTLLSANSGPAVEGQCGELARSSDSERVVVVIVDSLRPSLLASEFMPELTRFASKSQAYDLDTCIANFTLPCLKTLLEGRESPLGSRLHNFTGERGARDSLPAIAKRCGWRVDLISDHTLDTLYGEWASTSLNVEAAPAGVNTLDNDMRAFDAAQALLKTGHSRQILILHVPGTDKAGHFKGVGTPAYFEHFRRVDGRIGELVTTLTATDAVMILGDHGHDNSGNHTRGSKVIFGGERMDEAVTRAMVGEDSKTLDQADLLFFLMHATGLALPPNYEGRYFWLTGESSNGFGEIQSAALAQEGFEGPLAEQIAQKRAAQAQRGMDTLIRVLPAVVFLLAYVILLGLALVRRRRPDPAVFAAAALAPVALALSQLGAWPLSVLMGLLAMGFLMRRRETRRLALGVGILVVVSSGLSALGIGLNHLFWEVSTDPAMNILLLFGGVAFVGLIIAYVVFGSLDPWPETALLVGAIALPSGMYFFNSGPNLIRGLLIAGVLLLVWRWGIRGIEERKLPAVSLSGGVLVHMTVFLLIAVLVQLDLSASWRWQFLPSAYIRQVIPWAAWVVFLGVIAYVGFFGARRRSAAWAVAYAVAVVGYCVGVANLDSAQLAACSFMGAGVVAWHGLKGRLEIRTPSRVWSDFANAAIVFGFTMSAAWLLFDSFDVGHLEFAFAYDLVGPLSNEALRFAVYFAFAGVKYGLPIAMPGFFWWLMADDTEDTSALAVLAGACLLVVLKLAVLFSDIAFGVFATRERLYEIAISELVFTWYIGVVLAALLWALILFNRVFRFR